MKNVPTLTALPALSRSQMLCCVLIPCVVWALLSVMALGNLDSQHDMLENYAWSQPMLLGTHKHPPFFAWVVGVWFMVFPESDWAYRLLSYINVAVGLWGVLVLGQRLGLGNLARWGALLLLWTLPYTTLAGKFNANSQLLSVWPWTAALLLASWQEEGWRGWWYSMWLGVLAAASMLSKYYSGVFLAGFLLPIFLHPQGRRWLLTARPYVALAAFGLALLPHVLWMAQHDWAPIDYVKSQGEDGVVGWKYVARFALSPLFYWLPAWLAVCVLYGRHHSRVTGQAMGRSIAQCLWRIWMPQGSGDILFWLALMPWLMTLVFGITGMVVLSTPWAIPIGYAFGLLWLRNLYAYSPQAMAPVLQGLQRAWWPVVGGVVLFGVVAAFANALTGERWYYRPTREAAQAMLAQWEQRHPGKVLEWVGGEWTENASITFYARPGLLTIPDTPDSLGAQLAHIGDWRRREGLMLCALGATDAMSALSDNVCVRDSQAWLAQQGLDVQPHIVQVQRSGWRFPYPVSYSYAVFDVPATRSPD